MNPELERLEAALRAAHAAGDTEAARRFAMEIVRIRNAGVSALSSPPVTAPRQSAPAGPEVPEQMHEYYVRGGKLYFDREGKLEVPDPRTGEVVAPPAMPEDSAVTALARFRLEQGGTPSTSVDENTVRLRAQYDPNQAGVDPGTNAPGTAALRAKIERGEPLTPQDARALGYASPEEAAQAIAAEPFRAAGRASVEPGEGFNAAALVQGVGSGLFGVGTPLSALGEMIASRFDSSPGEMSWDESKSFARGRRDQLREQHPREFYGGVVGSLLVGSAAARGAGAAARAAGAPRAASVFTMQAGQTARNIARLSAAGAAAGGVTAANEEGLDAAAGGAALGAVAGPAMAGVMRVAAVPVRAVAGRLRPDNAAIRLLAKRMGESVAATQQRYDDFVTTRGRPPRLVEIMRRETAEEMGQISRVRSGAGAIFRQAEEEATHQLPGELSAQVRNANPITSEPALAARRAQTATDAAEVVGQRVSSSEAAQVGRRDVQMDRAMARIAKHRVPVTEQMLEVVQHPDVWNSLDPAVRRRLSAAIEAGGNGTPYLSVARWEMIRQDLAGRAGPGAGQIYARLRDRVRDYVSDAVPEYGAALREYGRRSDTARGTTAGQSVLTRSTREFADMIRTAGGGTVDNPQRPAVRAAEQVGIRVGARTAVANALGGEPAKAQRFMERLARDPAMRERVRLALRSDEATRLEQLAGRYGQQLDFSAGLSRGRGVLRQNDTDAFREAVALANQPERAGVRQGARAALSEAAGKGPAGALQTATRLDNDPELQSRIAFALGSDEATRLSTLGRSVTESSQRLAATSPNVSSAQVRAREQVEGIDAAIRGGLTLTGRWAPMFVNSISNSIVQRTRLSKRAARRLAEMAVDPAQAHQVIQRLRQVGVEADEILHIYQRAATAAGIQTGRE